MGVVCPRRPWRCAGGGRWGGAWWPPLEGWGYWGGSIPPQWWSVWRRVAGGGGFGVEADGECLGVSGALMGGPGVGCHPAMVEGEGGRPLQLGVVGGGVDDQVSLVIGGLGDLGQEVAQGWEGKAVLTWASGPECPLGEVGAEVVIAVCVLGPAFVGAEERSAGAVGVGEGEAEVVAGGIEDLVRVDAEGGEDRGGCEREGELDVVVAAGLGGLDGESDGGVLALVVGLGGVGGGVVGCGHWCLLGCDGPLGGESVP